MKGGGVDTETGLEIYHGGEDVERKIVGLG